ncbi:UxaA family hydrolase [Halalkalibacter kiskunsagensis]|uniref:UxaA family hydrolase n=1 Tax=Halalkalibacter kiskunsagensis TaxID=1548599 RepID=A0ABV6KFJ0_9BACI
MSENLFRTIIMRPIDNVAVALQDIPAGTQIEVTFSKKESTMIKIKEAITFGHKFAVRRIMKGTEIKKYGEVIGKALRDIGEGEHVHVHNLEGTRGRGDKVGTD